MVSTTSKTGLFWNFMTSSITYSSTCNKVDARVSMNLSIIVNDYLQDATL